MPLASSSRPLGPCRPCLPVLTLAGMALLDLPMGAMGTKDKEPLPPSTLTQTLTIFPIRYTIPLRNYDNRYTSSFRLGSGAAVPLPWFPVTNSVKPTAAARTSRPTMPLPDAKPLMEANMLKSTASAPGHRLPTPPRWLLQVIPAMIIVFLWCMMPAGPNTGMPQLTSGNFNYRIPPAWSPEQDHHYSFRAYLTDLTMWIMLTDLQPHQQCAAIIMRLGGAAREVSRMITPQEMINGGIRNGVQLDPVTYLLGALQVRFAA